TADAAFVAPLLALVGGFPIRPEGQPGTKQRDFELNGSNNAVGRSIRPMEVRMGYSSAQRSVFLVVLAAIAAGTAFATMSVAGVSRQDRSLGDPVVFLKGVVRQIA